MAKNSVASAVAGVQEEVRTTDRRILAAFAEGLILDGIYTIPVAGTLDEKCRAVVTERTGKTPSLTDRRSEEMVS